MCTLIFLKSDKHKCKYFSNVTNISGKISVDKVDWKTVPMSVVQADHLIKTLIQGNPIQTWREQAQTRSHHTEKWNHSSLVLMHHVWVSSGMWGQCMKQQLDLLSVTRIFWPQPALQLNTMTQHCGNLYTCETALQNGNDRVTINKRFRKKQSYKMFLCPLPTKFGQQWLPKSM